MSKEMCDHSCVTHFWTLNVQVARNIVPHRKHSRSCQLLSNRIHKCTDFQATTPIRKPREVCTEWNSARYITNNIYFRHDTYPLFLIIKLANTTLNNQQVHICGLEKSCRWVKPAAICNELNANLVEQPYFPIDCRSWNTMAVVVKQHSLALRVFPATKAQLLDLFNSGV